MGLLAIAGSPMRQRPMAEQGTAGVIGVETCTAAMRDDFAGRFDDTFGFG